MTERDGFVGIATLKERFRLTRDEWLAERLTGIGSSDSPAILGLSRRKTPLHIYMEKADGHRDDSPSKEAVAGIKLEPYVASMYEQHTGVKLAKDGEWVVYRSKVYPWLIASIDYKTDDRLVEIKTSQSREGWGEPGTDRIPAEYYVQVQHQMAVMSRKMCDVAVLFSGVDFAIYHVERDEDFIRKMISILMTFWEKVIKREPPSFTWEHPATRNLVRGMAKLEANSFISLDGDDEFCANVKRYDHIRTEIAELERERDALYNQIIVKMNGYETAHAGGGWYAKMNRDVNGRLSLRVKKPKGNEDERTYYSNIIQESQAVS